MIEPIELTADQRALAIELSRQKLRSACMLATQALEILAKLGAACDGNDDESRALRLALNGSESLDIAAHLLLAEDLPHLPTLN